MEFLQDLFLDQEIVSSGIQSIQLFSQGVIRSTQQAGGEDGWVLFLHGPTVTEDIH